MNTSDSEVARSKSLFKAAQQRYRRQADRPNRVDDAAEWIDFSRIDDPRVQAVVPPVSQDTVSDNNHDNYYQGPLFSIKDAAPGFLYAPQALHSSLQDELSWQAVTSYCEAPHVTNIDSVPPKANEIANLEENMWYAYQATRHDDDTTVHSHNHNFTKKYRSLNKLTWATAGYHYDWTERAYTKSRFSPLPPLVAQISKQMADTALHIWEAPAPVAHKWTPQASICNYYHLKSQMGGHCDDLEYVFDHKPIVSLCLGRPAIFLLELLEQQLQQNNNDASNTTIVWPILVRPGDVMIMGGASRLARHGVARILPLEAAVPEPTRRVPPSQQLTCSSVGETTTTQSTDHYEAVRAYLRDHRININVRQVYPDDHDVVESTSTSIGGGG